MIPRDLLVKDTNGKEVGLARLVDTINASDLGRDQFNALTNLDFQVNTGRNPENFQAQAHADGTIEIFLSPDGSPNENGLFITDALFSVITHAGH